MARFCISWLRWLRSSHDWPISPRPYAAHHLRYTQNACIYSISSMYVENNQSSDKDKLTTPVFSVSADRSYAQLETSATATTTKRGVILKCLASLWNPLDEQCRMVTWICLSILVRQSPGNPYPGRGQNQDLHPPCYQISSPWRAIRHLSLQSDHDNQVSVAGLVFSSLCGFVPRVRFLNVILRTFAVATDHTSLGPSPLLSPSITLENSSRKAVIVKKRAAPPPSTPTVMEPKRKKHAKTKRGQWDEIEDIFS
jgi:hypothetical protein